LHGIVASGHPETSAAVAEILADGGNAFDAAIAGLLVASVAEPLLSSLGGGGFLIAETGSQTPRLFDFFAQTPASANPDHEELYPIHGDFGTRTQEFHIGAGAIAVPGMIHGLFHIHAELAQLPFSRLAEPAIRLAHNGVTVNAFQARIAEILAPITQAQPGVKALFAPDGKLLEAGVIQVQSDLANTLEALVADGPDLFYRGELGQQLVDFCARQGGHVSAADLAAYTTIERTPLAVSYANHRIWTNPVPSAGGTLIGHCLRLLDGLRSRNWQLDPGRFQQLLPHVMAATNIERLRSGLQHHTDEETARSLLADEPISELVDLLERHRPAYRGTTHISVIDNQGNMASSSVSNGEGCGHLLPDTGVHLNNFLGEQDLMPEGAGVWRAARRLSSMMAPTLVQVEGGGRMALGSGGSNRLRTAITQVLVQILELGQDVETAVKAPRMHLEDEQLSLEPGFDPAVIDQLKQRFPTLEVWDHSSLFFGGVHLVRATADGQLSGCGDPRRGGTVTTV
jgi:gamma-glutamyltranspeptidase/glutathione hydrolase